MGFPVATVGGTLVLVGLCTRPAAFILSGEMAAAYFIAHAPRGNFLVPILPVPRRRRRRAWSIDAARHSRPT